MSDYGNNYTCVVKTELDEDSAKATLRVKDRPNAPVITAVECDTKESRAIIFWNSTLDNGDPIIDYAIEANAGFTPNRWDTMVEKISAESGSVSVQYFVYE